MPQKLTGKPVIYQVFTRLFGNHTVTHQPWGTQAENGIGKFADFDDLALKAIKNYGVSHIWYTGVPQHALLTSYPGITDDHPDVVKGRAGSPYAIKDYYQVNPDLAIDPQQRLNEFRALIERSHRHGLKVIIDIVPNHVARQYQSTGAPAGVRDFGADDDSSKVYDRDNNFYYLPDERFQPPATDQPFKVATPYDEIPAKWSGNGTRSAQPQPDDWYETIKINYGIRLDGSKDFTQLPEDYRQRLPDEHVNFWADQSVPSSWRKLRDIVHYWLALGVDGFRYDVAEMVPVEFWSYLNSSVKQVNPEALLIAEVYQPELYRDYLELGLMDLLYDKVGVYDSLRAILQGQQNCSVIDGEQHKLADIDAHMLRFLENHDEQRLASPEFAGSGERGWPAMVVTTLLGSSPTMLYFGQAQGEAAASDTGFGKASRTSIFDYTNVPAHQKWMNQGLFDGGGLNAREFSLDAAYQRLMSLSSQEQALLGEFHSLHTWNLSQNDNGYNDLCYSFIRHSGQHTLLVLVNFNHQNRDIRLSLPAPLTALLGLKPNQGLLELLNPNWQQNQLYRTEKKVLEVPVHCPANGALVFKILPENRLKNGVRRQPR